VTDNNGASSAPDTVNILVKNRPANLPPRANAGPDQTVNQGTTVTLDGSASSDRDGSIEYYQWTQTAGPLVALNETDEHVAPQKATFTAPNVGLNGATTTLTFRLTIFDSDGATGRDTVNVKVINGGQNATTTQNNSTQPATTTAANNNNNNTKQNQTTTTTESPTADAGPDQTVNERDNVKLDGSGSSDPDGDTLTYSWTQTAGPAITLSNADSATPSFTAPEIDSADDTLTFKLTVNDGNGHTATDTVNVLVKNVAEQQQSPPPSSPSDETTTTSTTSSTPTTTTTSSTTNTALTLNPISNVPWGQTVTVTGKLTSAYYDSGISGQTITLSGTGIKQQQQQQEQEQQTIISAKTQSDGTFTATFTAPNTVASGWTVQAHYAGDDDSNLQSSDSEERTFDTLKHGSTLSLILDPAQVAKGGSYTVHGELKDSVVTNEFIASMTITFTAADKPININSTTTDSSGSYEVSGLKAPTKSESYNIEAKFAGNSLYDLATSGKQMLVVK
jgi:hypothetical protein